MKSRSLVALLLGMTILWTVCGEAQTLVTITDTLKNADGTNAAGRLLISWDPFTAASGETIDGGTITYTITSGVVSISLAPNIGATPAGTSYRAQYYLTNRASYRETWVIPATGPVTIAAIRVSIVPSPTVTFNAATQLTGIVPIANGGTGLSALGSADLCLKVNSGGTALEYGSCASGGTGITSLNGLTAATQTFATPGTTGTAPNWSSATSIHTLNIPLAATASVTAGLLSKTDYDTFNAKESALTFNSPLSRSVNTITCPTCSVSGHTHVEANITDLAHRLAGTGITLNTNTFDFTPAEVGAVTWLDNADRSWTFDIAAAGTNPVMAFASGVVNLTAGVWQQGGTAVSLTGHTHVEANITDLSHVDASKLPLAGGTMTGELVLRAAGVALSGGGLVDCDTAGTSKLLWDATTARFSCGTDQTGGGSAHDILSATHTDSTAAAVSRGSLIVGQTATPKWQELVIGAANTVLGSDGADATWTSLTDAHVPDTITLTNITQITNRAISNTTGDLAASRVDDGAAASTQALFSGGAGAAGFRAIADADVPDSITVTLAATATALAADPGDCAAGLFTAGVNASGTAQGCTDLLSEVELDTFAELDSQIADFALLHVSNTATLTNKTIDGASNDLQTRRHATDCTGLTDGKDGEQCYEQDADTLYVCEPTAGDCDTAGEWRLVSGASDGVGYDEVLDEASGLTKRAQLNFIGAGVSCVDNAGATRTDCTISSSGDSEKTHYVPLICDTPDTVTNPGESFVQSINLDPIQAALWHLADDGSTDVDATIYCHVRVPENLGSTPASAIVLDMAANNTTASETVRLQISWVAIANTETHDATFTDETAVTTGSWPTTAYARFDFTEVLGSQPTAGDYMAVKIFRDVNHAGDIMDIDVLIFDAFLRIDLTL